MRLPLLFQLHTLGLVGGLLIHAPGVAAQPGSPGPDRLVHDGARVMQPVVVARLEQQLRRYRDSTGVELAVVTVESLHGQEIAQVGDSLKNAWGIGSKQTQRGILYLIAPGVPRQTIRTGRGLEADLPDALCFRILKQSRPTLRQDPQAAILSRVAGIQQQLAGAASREKALASAEADFHESRGLTVQEQDDGHSLMLPLLLLGLGALVMLTDFFRGLRRRRQAKAPLQMATKPLRTGTTSTSAYSPSSYVAPSGGSLGTGSIISWDNADDSSRKTSGSSSFGFDDTSSGGSFYFGGDTDTGGGGASSD